MRDGERGKRSYFLKGGLPRLGDAAEDRAHACQVQRATHDVHARPPARARLKRACGRRRLIHIFAGMFFKKLLCIQFVVSPSACDGPLRRGPPRSPRCLFSQCSTCGAGTARVGSHRFTL